MVAQRAVRPKNADSKETWDRIVAYAKQALEADESGEADLSLRQISVSAGLSLGTIHYYFATKEALLEACLDQYYESLGVLANELAMEVGGARKETAHATIERCLRRIYRFAYSERARLRLRARTNAVRGRLHPDRHVHVRGPILDTFSAILAPLVGTDEKTIRLTFQSMTFVVMQYVLLDDLELEQVTGQTGEAARAAIEDHIVALALRALYPAAMP